MTPGYTKFWSIYILYGLKNFILYVFVDIPKALPMLALIFHLLYFNFETSV